MIYLVNNNIYTLNNGPEFSQFERLKAFNDHGLPTKLLLMYYSNNLADDIVKHNVDPQAVINMYDYFQGTAGQTGEPRDMHEMPDFDYSRYHLKSIDANHAVFDAWGTQFGTIHVAPSTVGKVGDVEYHDQNGRTVARVFWDRRGFVSRLDSYHLDGQLGTTRYLKPDGTTAIELIRMNNNGSVQPTMWKLINYKGHDRVFDNEIALFSFFLNEINQQEPGTFITDRHSVEGSVLAVQNATKKIAYFHDIPVQNPRKAASSPVNGWAETTFDTKQMWPVHFNNLVFPTAAEGATFQKRFGKNLPKTEFDAINDSYVTPVKQVHPLNVHQPIFVYRGMLSLSRGIMTVVKAFNEIHRQIPGAVLKLQGYVNNQDDINRVKDQIQKMKIGTQVQFLPYSPANDLSVLNDATVFLNATDVEAFGMNMLEAMSRAVPVISFDGHYHSGNLIKSGENGWLTKRRNARGLAEAALQVITDADLYAKLARGALTTAQKFSEETLVRQWQQVLDE